MGKETHPAGSARSKAAHRRRPIQRSRLLLGASATVAVIVVAAWFPASALYHQHQQLAATDGQLAKVRQQNDALSSEAKRLQSNAEVARIARQQYELVDPGQTLYQVLPAAGSTSTGTYADAPGTQEPVTPSGASELPAGSPGTQASGTSPSHHAGTSSGTDAQGGHGSTGSLFGRMVRTLEFWR